MLNLWTVGKNSNPVFSRLWIKIHAILRWCRRPVLVAKALTRLSIYCVVRKKLALSCEVVEKKVVFGPPICRGRGYPWFWTCVFKLHLLPSMWLILV